ncbi:hypothetical protein [Mycobacterium seoulense]|uniref:hypothetical protein n=1 Tax=Mycobacterium seoulense TaxID=386911 RepID=UPI0013D5EA2A|nr:hypothetical protein [Mycobacterium seoulense]MCV7438199.1 hypothetical protein [Mycobacterium seoulense]
MTMQEQLLAEVDEHRGAGAADRAGVSMLDVTLIPGSRRTGSVDDDPSTLVEPSHRTRLLVTPKPG